MWRIDKGWVYIAGTTIQSTGGQGNSLTDNWSLYVGSRIFSEGSLEHQLTLDQPKNPLKKNLEREIGASISAIKTKKGEIDAGDEIELTTAEDVTDVSSHLTYNFHQEEFLAGLQYNAPVLDYETLGYGGNKSVPVGYDAEQDYTTQMPADGQSDMLTTQEAADTFMNIQYHVLQGNIYEVSSEDRRRFNLWIAFNPALFKMLESQQGLTRDVNYTMN